MSFQRRVTLAAATAVAVAVALASGFTYVLVRNGVDRHIDHSLRNLASAFIAAEHQTERGSITSLFGSPTSSTAPFPYGPLLRSRFPGRPGDITDVFEVISSKGASYPAFEGLTLPLSGTTKLAVMGLARAGSGTWTFDATAHGTQYRVLAAGVSAGYAVLVTHSLTEAASTLSSLRLTLVILTLGGIALASLLGWF
ncbi:MAG: hypothetical protein ACRDLP_09210, partial [Solirubrobacteraceae bacterium]